MALTNRITVLGQKLKAHRALVLDILKELTILIGVYLVYSVSRGSLGEKTVLACRHALDVVDLEKALGIYVEPNIQSFFLESSLRTDIANILYTICYYPALIIFAIWAYWRHRQKFKFVRTAFVISAALAFIIFALYPVAPPRFFDGGGDNIRCDQNLGFVDTIHEHWNVSEEGSQAFYNPYAAIPSLHQGWTLMICAAILWMTRSRIAMILAVVLPIGMFIGITSTANHFVLDAAAGALTTAVAFGLAWAFYRALLRYKVWHSKQY